MQIPSAHLKASDLPLEKLAGNYTLSGPEKLHEVSRQFEAILVRQIIGEAQKPVFKSKFNATGVAGDVYRDLITQQTADQISRSGSLGLARALETQLQRQFKMDPKTAAQAPDSSAPPHQGAAPPTVKYDSKA